MSEVIGTTSYTSGPQSREKWVYFDIFPLYLLSLFLCFYFLFCLLPIIFPSNPSSTFFFSYPYFISHCLPLLNIHFTPFILHALSIFPLFSLSLIRSFLLPILSPLSLSFSLPFSFSPFPFLLQYPEDCNGNEIQLFIYAGVNGRVISDYPFVFVYFLCLFSALLFVLLIYFFSFISIFIFFISSYKVVLASCTPCFPHESSLLFHSSS